MILPGSQLLNIILLIFGMFCIGSWAITLRMAPKWRFELYCFDFVIGAFLAALLLGLTFGSLGWDGFALSDDVGIAGKQKDAIAVAAGVVFSLGNMLILGALSVAGVTVAYMIGVGIMLTSGIVIMRFTSPSGNGAMLAAGAVMIVVSAVLIAYSSKMHSMERLTILIREGKTKSTRKSVSIKGILLAAGGGLIAGGYFPLMNSARDGENGLGPYSLGIFFVFGMGLSILVFNLFFMNLPVTGEALELSAYFEGRAKFHWLGVLGGILWYLGFACALIVARAEGNNVVAPYLARALMLAAPLVGALWGLLRWKEFAGASGKVRITLLMGLLAFVMGVAGLCAAAGLSSNG